MAEIEIVTRPPQPYAAMQLTLARTEIGAKAPPLHKKVMDWLAARGAMPEGPPFFNYTTFNADGTMGMEVGWPTRGVLAEGTGIVTGTLPGGRYARLLYAGPYSGLGEANMAVLDWARANGHALAERAEAGRMAGATRLEVYLTEHDAKPPVTEVAMKLAE